jgi:hypothetical protein
MKWPGFSIRSKVLSGVGVLVLLGIFAVNRSPSDRHPIKTIVVDAENEGRTFEGLGAVSAGASSRLLIDYPEPQRSQILDYLFKPNFGAGIQHLKVEIGGDVNSTDGCEPSHMHTPEDENYHRGYEWWLMKEAKKRNPQVILDCLAWGAPYWIGKGEFYSQDMADYIAKFIRAAKLVHGLDIDYTGIWNETVYDMAWIKLLRRRLDANGLKQVKIVATDEPYKRGWAIVDEMVNDAELRGVIDVIGAHYPKFESPRQAKKLGKPLWSSEDGPWHADWMSAMTLARTYNRNYVVGRMTKTEIWSPVTAYYDNLPVPGSGIMRANTPWSGHYEVPAAVWITAHTTQFAQPGWKYLDSACILFPGGSVVALKSPSGNDFSIVIETMDAENPQTLFFQVGGDFADKPLHVWRTDSKEYFAELEVIQPRKGAFTFAADERTIYSLTTTTGQGKGASTPLPAKPFLFPYREDFESYLVGATPRYFSDQSGIFEIVKRADGNGNSLRQIVPQKGIEWRAHFNPAPETFLGALNWADYEFSVDALIEKAGFVSLFGRIGKIPQSFDPPNGYWLKVTARGEWELSRVKTIKGSTQDPKKIIGSGKVHFSADEWHRVGLEFAGTNIHVMIDDKQVAQIEDATFRAGMVGLGSGWHGAQFDNLSVSGNVETE